MSCFWVQRVERAAAARAPATACGWIVGSRADVARRVVGTRGGGARARGVAAGVASCTVRIRIWRSTAMGAAARSMCQQTVAAVVRGACRAHAAQRGAAGGDLADQSGAAEASGVGVMAGGRHRCRGGRRGGEHGRGGAGSGGWAMIARAAEDHELASAAPGGRLLASVNAGAGAVERPLDRASVRDRRRGGQAGLGGGADRGHRRRSGRLRPRHARAGELQGAGRAGVLGRGRRDLRAGGLEVGAQQRGPPAAA